MREEENEETRRRRKDLSCAKEGEREKERKGERERDNRKESWRGFLSSGSCLIFFGSGSEREKEREKKRRAAGPKNEMPPLETFYRAIRRS